MANLRHPGLQLVEHASPVSRAESDPCARAVLPYLVERKTPLGRWAYGLLARAHKNVVVVALANKLARIAWVVLARGGVYDAGYEAAAA
jgi:transposase